MVEMIYDPDTLNIRIRGEVLEIDTIIDDKYYWEFDVVQSMVFEFNRQTTFKLGELTLDPSKLASTVSINNSSHCVVSLEIKKNKLIGVVEILNTKSGKLAIDWCNSFEKEMKLSPRAIGSFREQIIDGKPVLVVNEDVELISVDLIMEPSNKKYSIYDKFFNSNVIGKGLDLCRNIIVVED